MGGNVLGEELHIVEGSTGSGESGGSLDVVRAGVGNALAQGDLFFVGEQAGLNDDLQEAALAGLLDGGDLRGDLVPLAFLGPADVDDHVYFPGPVVHGVGGHKALGGGGVVAVGETDDGADGQLVAHVLLGLLHKGSRNAYRGGVVLHAVIADGPDIGPGCGLGKQSMIAGSENFR